MRKQKHVVIINVSRNGDTQIKVEGVKGKSCKDVTAQLERELGEVVSDVPTREFYETETETKLRTRG